MRTCNLGLIVLAGLISITSLLQTQSATTEFDAAHAHRHTRTVTFEGEWVKRSNEPAKGGAKYLLGNAFWVRADAIKNGAKFQFYREFLPEIDGPTIAMLESRPHTRVLVTYDPVCSYATQIKFAGVTKRDPPSL